MQLIRQNVQILFLVNDQPDSWDISGRLNHAMRINTMSTVRVPPSRNTKHTHTHTHKDTPRLHIKSDWSDSSRKPFVRALGLVSCKALVTNSKNSPQDKKYRKYLLDF